MSASLCTAEAQLVAAQNAFVRNCSVPVFNPDLINHTLSLVEWLDTGACSAESIIRVLSMECAK
ncbi:hypothetical protein C2C36_22210 [Escherichia coli]|uniref:hypothetical protein n=1 Tax=Escherichia coli TaxID=562 RepID=UPI00179E9B9B|nr:hypothetical protein [Escherichia coli]